jgi:hypothetical protein
MHFGVWKVIASCTDDCMPDGSSKFGEKIGRSRGFTIPEPVPWRPSIHMPRWASRILLEVKSVRVERVQEISPSDAISEGVACECEEFGKCAITDSCLGSVREFMTLWNSINEKRGYGWEKNPWVWVVEFEVVG